MPNESDIKKKSNKHLHLQIIQPTSLFKKTEPAQHSTFYASFGGSPNLYIVNLPWPTLTIRPSKISFFW